MYLKKHLFDIKTIIALLIMTKENGDCVDQLL